MPATITCATPLPPRPIDPLYTPDLPRSAGKERKLNRPNIIFYFTDQQRWDTLGCYGQKLPVSPVLDALAARGTLFENAFTCQPVCGPARACLQTGLYATQAGVHINNRALPPDADTLARRLTQGGYETAYIGKWHLASDEEHNYMTSAVPPERRGGYGFWLAADTLEFTSHGYNGYLYDGDLRRREFTGHRIDCLNAFAVDYLHSYAQGPREKPFFLMISHLDPHHQNDRYRYEGPDGSKKRFAGFEVPPDLAGKPGDYLENYPDYLGQCNLIDQNVGRLMDTLEQTGLAENTVVLYASDHGSHFRTRNSEYKRSCEDSCLHVPLLAWGGVFDGGGRIGQLVSLIDLPPTILDLAGLKIPAHYQGHSLLKLRHGETNAWPDSVYAQISESQTARMIRTRQWCYCVSAPRFNYTDAFSDTYAEEKLYDLIHDPVENVNLVRDPAYASVREQLREKLLAYMDRAGEPRAVILPAP